MYVLLTILSILVFLTAVFLILLAVFPVKIALSYDSEQLKEYRVLFSWLRPLFRGSFIKDDERTVLCAYVLGIKLMERELGEKTSNRRDTLNMIREVHPHLKNLEASYGFSDPSVTGMVCGSINMLPNLIKIDSLENHPDFSMEKDYFNAHATAEVNALNSLRIMLKNRNKAVDIQPQH